MSLKFFPKTGTFFFSTKKVERVKSAQKNTPLFFSLQKKYKVATSVRVFFLPRVAPLKQHKKSWTKFLIFNHFREVHDKTKNSFNAVLLLTSKLIGYL